MGSKITIDKNNLQDYINLNSYVSNYKKCIAFHDCTIDNLILYDDLFSKFNSVLFNRNVVFNLVVFFGANLLPHIQDNSHHDKYLFQYGNIFVDCVFTDIDTKVPSFNGYYVEDAISFSSCSFTRDGPLVFPHGILFLNGGLDFTVNIENCSIDSRFELDPINAPGMRFTINASDSNLQSLSVYRCDSLDLNLDNVTMRIGTNSGPLGFGLGISTKNLNMNCSNVSCGSAAICFDPTGSTADISTILQELPSLTRALFTDMTSSGALIDLINNINNSNLNLSIVANTAKNKVMNKTLSNININSLELKDFKLDSCTINKVNVDLLELSNVTFAHSAIDELTCKLFTIRGPSAVVYDNIYTYSMSVNELCTRNGATIAAEDLDDIKNMCPNMQYGNYR